MAVDIKGFVDPGEFKKTTGDILREQSNSTKSRANAHLHCWLKGK